jgi:hypothetical protein
VVCFGWFAVYDLNWSLFEFEGRGGFILGFLLFVTVFRPLKVG